MKLFCHNGTSAPAPHKAAGGAGICPVGGLNPVTTSCLILGLKFTTKCNSAVNKKRENPVLSQLAACLRLLPQRASDILSMQKTCPQLHSGSLCLVPPSQRLFKAAHQTHVSADLNHLVRDQTAETRVTEVLGLTPSSLGVSEASVTLQLWIYCKFFYVVWFFSF